MDDNDIPRMARQRFLGEPDKAARDAMARAVLERARWYRSNQGRRKMTEKGYRPIAVASGMIQDVFDLVGEAGMSPLQVLGMALLNYSAVQGFESPEIEEVRAFVGTVLDRADAKANPNAPAEADA